MSYYNYHAKAKQLITHVGEKTHDFNREDDSPLLKAMPSLWIRSYFVSTAGNVSSETIKWYVDIQKTRL